MHNVYRYFQLHTTLPVIDLFSGCQFRPLIWVIISPVKQEEEETKTRYHEVGDLHYKGTINCKRPNDY
jgi:hypothetical protein